MSGKGDNEETVVIEVVSSYLTSSNLHQAKLRGPGPGRYGLPSTCGQNGHDFTKLMKPAFSFGKRLGNSLVDGKQRSPGPVYHVRAEITRHGREGTAKYTQQGRRKVGP